MDYIDCTLRLSVKSFTRGGCHFQTYGILGGIKHDFGREWSDPCQQLHGMVICPTGSESLMPNDMGERMVNEIFS